MTPRPSGRNFAVLWVGQAVNLLGSQITIVAIPLLAVHALQAGPAQIGLLQACTSAAFVLVGLPAGPLVDRVPKRRVLVVANLSSALLVGTIVLTYHNGTLTQAHLYVAALALGVCSVVAGVAFISIVPEVVPGSQLITATGRLSVVQTVAQVLGPAAAGVLLGVVGPADAILVDALSFLVAAGSILLLRLMTTTEPSPPSRESLLASMVAGVRFVTSTPLLRRITYAASAATLFGAVWQSAHIVFLVRTLHASNTTVGIVIALSAVGGVAAGLAAPRLFARFGRPVFIRWAMPVSCVPGLLMVAGGPGLLVLLVAVADFFMMFGSILFNVAQTSARLDVCPRRMLGRMNATIRTTVWTSSTVGSLLGALLATALDSRMLILTGILGTLVATAVCGLRDIELVTPVPSAR